jgi:hypothetical protein
MLGSEVGIRKGSGMGVGGLRVPVSTRLYTFIMPSWWDAETLSESSAGENDTTLTQSM